jgi:hypothetical protein
MSGESVTVTQEFAGPDSNSALGLGSARIGADGSFIFPALPPGEYRLSVRGSSEGGRVEGATTTVSLVGEDAPGVALVAATGGSLSGRVVTDTGEAISTSDMKGFRLFARPLDPSSTLRTSDPNNGSVGEDNTFVIVNVFGPSLITLGTPPEGWVLRGILHGDKDLADVPITLEKGQQIEDITVVLSKSLPVLAGTLSSDLGKPTDATVVMFPQDASLWLDDARRIRVERVDDIGRFQFRNVVPGSYFVVAVDYLAKDERTDPGVLTKLAEKAARITVNQGSSPTVSLSHTVRVTSSSR